MWSDNETKVDLLDFLHLKDSVLSIVRNDSLLPTTIGVFGDWGSGKSSLLQMVTDDLEADGKILCLSFNGWLFDGYEDAKSALMGTILHEIRQRRKLGAKAQELVASLLGRIDKMKAAGMAFKHGLAFAVGGPAALGLTVGVDFLANVRDLAAKAKDFDMGKLEEILKDAWPADAELRKGILEFRTDFDKLLMETDIGKLVVVIDDLDRCNPDTIIETLEAIKLFLFVPRTAFILGADKRLIEYAVRRRFPELPGERVEVGRDYLEKLVQFPVTVPPLDRAETETYINLLFVQISSLDGKGKEIAREAAKRKSADQLYGVGFNAKVAQQLFKKLPDDLVEYLSLAEQLSSVLASGLSGNPRQCKRFLNTLLMRVNMAKSRGIDLKKRVLAKLMLLEYFRSEFFKQLAKLQMMHAGVPPQLVALEKRMGEQGSDDQKATGERNTQVTDVASALDAESQLWVSDEFTADWLRMEPFLRGVDLRPYFFFSRDNLGPLSDVIRRLTPAAQEVLTKLVHKSEAVKGNGLKEARNLNQAEVNTIFETLSGRVQKSEDLGAEESPLGILIELTRVRPELHSQLVSVLARLPEKTLPLAVVPKLIVASDGAKAGAAKILIERWSKSGTNIPLAKAAAKAVAGGARISPRTHGKGCEA